MKDDNGLGVMITPDVTNINDKTPRSTNKEVFEFIEKDLAFGATVLSKGENQYRVDVNVINALQARLTEVNMMKQKVMLKKS